MKIEVLVATMNQNEENLYEKMKIKTDAIFANQTDEHSYQEILKNKNNLKLIRTLEKGVGKNRNLGIMYSTGDICLFSDDDLVYTSDYNEVIEGAFLEIPNADIIIFNIEIQEKTARINKKIKKLHMFNVLNYGAPRIAIKRSSLLKKNLWFSLLYGGGAPYSSGEDSLFLVEALRKGLKIYSYPQKIATVVERQSTWFTGFNEKYYNDKGYWIANAFPKIKFLLLVYFSYKLNRNNSTKSIFEIYKLLYKGIKKYTKENDIK